MELPEVCGGERDNGDIVPRLAYDLEETARCLGLSTKTVRRLIERGLLRRSKAIRHILVPKSEIEKFLVSTCE